MLICRGKYVLPHSVFLWFAIPIGLLLIWFTPPFQSPDEQNHYFRAVHIAGGHWVGEIKGGDRVGGTIPVGCVQVAEHFRRLRFDYNAKTGAEDISKAFRIPYKPDSLQYVDFPNTGYTPPTGYLPAVTALWLIKPSGAHPLWWLYVARLAMFTFWLIPIYRGIRLMPVLRWLMVILALMPAHLALATTLNPHTVIYAVVFYMIGRTFRWAYTERARVIRREWWTYLLSAMIIAFNYVIVYIPITSLFLLIPARKTNGILPFIRRIFTLMLFQAALLIVWAKYAKDWFIPYDQYDEAVRDNLTMNPGVNPDAQMEFMLSEPMRFVGIAIHSLVETLPATLAHYVGKFGWEKNYLPAPIILLLYIGIFAAMFLQPDGQYRPKLRHRIFLLLLGLGCSAGVAAALYVVWSPVGATEILSLSGRYFIPTLPPVWLACSWPLSRKGAEYLPAIIAGIVAIGHISLLWCMWTRYYH